MHTVIVSDLHLSEVPAADPKRPLWRAFMHKEHTPDLDVLGLLEEVLAELAEADEDPGPIELIFNGDTFDFDNILAVPRDKRTDWLARRRGLASEEWMSVFKMDVIIEAHAELFDGLRAFLAAGNRVVFVAGNHDLELLWPAVQERIRERLDIDSEQRTPTPRPVGSTPPPLTFSNWFYVSGEDTFVTHGHQYDANCSVRDMVNPVIRVNGRERIRIPFGDLAERYMLNGMGYFNPHATENFIMPLVEYIRFFAQYMLRTQPLLAWTWFWSAIATLYISLREHWRPPLRDPLLVEEKLQGIAVRARTTPAVVRRLRALDVAPAAARPLRIFRELWLDRALGLFLAFYVSWQVVLHINFVWPISPLWIFVPLALAIPPFVAYAIDVNPTVFAAPLLTPDRAELIAKITGVDRVVMGHTHEPIALDVGSVEYLNGGFWSAAFSDPECTQRQGSQTYVWIRPEPGAATRSAALLEWKAPPDPTKLPPSPTPAQLPPSKEQT